MLCLQVQTETGIATKAWRKVRGRTAKHALRRAVACDCVDAQLLELHAQVSKFLFNGSVPPEWNDFAAQQQRVRQRMQQQRLKQGQVHEGKCIDTEEQGRLRSHFSLESSDWELVDAELEEQAGHDLQSYEAIEKEEAETFTSDGDEVEQDVLVKVRRHQRVAVLTDRQIGDIFIRSFLIIQ